MNKIPNHIILYDGYCKLCSHSIRFIIKNETYCEFLFLPLQSEEGQKFLNEHQIDTVSANSFVYIKDGNAFQKSTAALLVCRQIRKLKWLSIFLYVPQMIRDLIYSFIAKYRHKWFGTHEDCYLP